MKTTTTLWRWLAPGLAVALLAGCERPPVETVQTGYRGTGMVQVYNPRILAEQQPQNQPPLPLPPASPDGPRAKDIYQNVQVLGDLSIAQFTRNMVAITAWVAPETGCAYCHNLANLADDSKYTKVVARRMIQMTQHINVDHKRHVAETGVTCYTCHRGNPVPSQIWFGKPPQRDGSDFIGRRDGQNEPLRIVGLSSLPSDVFDRYLVGDPQEIRVNGNTALPTGNVASIRATEQSYGLMMHLSQSLGVNCTYCHNTRQLSQWDGGPPQRLTAWYGLQMVPGLNNDYVVPLTPLFPAPRLGPTGDVGKINCGTCHQGAYKPLNGAEMAKHHPELQVKTDTRKGVAPLDAPAGVVVVVPAATASAAEGGTR